MGSGPATMPGNPKSLHIRARHHWPDNGLLHGALGLLVGIWQARQCSWVTQWGNYYYLTLALKTQYARCLMLTAFALEVLLGVLN